VVAVALAAAEHGALMARLGPLFFAVGNIALTTLVSGPMVRYRYRRGSIDLGAGVGNDRPMHLRDPAKGQKAEAQREQAEAEEALKQLPAVREWVGSAGRFAPRQLREVFDFSPASCTRIIAALVKEGSVESHQEGAIVSYIAKPFITSPANRDGKRPLDADGGTLESRLLGMIDSEGMTLEQIGARGGVSQEVAQKVVSKLYKEGHVRSRSRAGKVHFVAAA
jgi:hypothetical protein